MLSSSILGKTYYIYLNSIFFAFLKTIFCAFSRAFKNSRIVHIFVRESRLEPIYAKSLIARSFKVIIDFITGIFAGIFTFFRRYYNGSATKLFYERYLKSSFFFNYETLLGGFICVMFIIPHSYWANPLALIGIAGFLLLYLVLVGAGVRRPYYLHDMGLPILLFIIACVFSLLFTSARGDSLRVLMFYITALLFLYVISADITNKQRLMRLLGFIYIAVILTSLYAIYQRFVGVEVSASLTDLSINEGVPGRVFSTLGNPNNYAEFLVIMTPMAAVFAANAERKWLRVPLCAAIVFTAIALLMTYSRSGWISMLLACIVFVYYANKKLLPVFFLVCVAAIPFLPDSVMIRIASLFNTQDSSNSFRIYVWSGTVKIARDYFFTGIGLGPETFAAIYPDYAHPKALVGAPHSHMVYLELIIELGVLGFISFMWYMLRLWKDSACSLLASKNAVVRFTLIACLSSLIGIAFTFCVEYVWYYPRTFFAYFILAAIATAAIRITKNERNTPKYDIK